MNILKDSMLPISLSFSIFRWVILALVLRRVQATKTKIAVIGGGISGSFLTKYLTDLDPTCTIESITIFDPHDVTAPVRYDTVFDEEQQGSRVANVELADGSSIELGASIAHKGFHLILDMIKNDESVEIGLPFNTGKEIDPEKLKKGFGIFDGDGWPLNTAGLSPLQRKLRLLWRYNFDLLKVDRACEAALTKFAELPKLLESTDPDTFYASPNAIWEALGLQNAVNSTFDEYLDYLGVAADKGFIRSLLFPGQGSLRRELLDAINLVNYNQGTKRINGLVGLGSFAATSGGLFSVKGGNNKIIGSARRQANSTNHKKCNGSRNIEYLNRKVATVVGSVDGFVLYSDEEEIGNFDLVVLAAPIQQTKAAFLIQSQNDPAVLQTMPLGGLIDAHAMETEDGHTLLPTELSGSAKRPYTQVVTTIVSNGKLNHTRFLLDEENLPRSIMFTENGKASLYNISAISEITPHGIFKIFSQDVLEDSALQSIFGRDARVEVVKIWGGKYGGATPDYQGEGTSTPFLLFDAASGLIGHSKSALYYTNAMEQSSLACMEISAIGAKAVAKLIAQRLNLLPESVAAYHDEL